MKLGRKKKRMDEVVELNITAFMNLMVILVPFLLITAVFSRMTVIELNLPALNAKSNGEKQELKLQLQIAVTADSYTVQDGTLGVMKVISRRDDNGDIWPEEEKQKKLWKPLIAVLLELKIRFPDVQDISLLLDRNVNYRTMIELMDHVRSADVVEAATLETVELFPLVSIGDLASIDSELDSSAEIGSFDSEITTEGNP